MSKDTIYRQDAIDAADNFFKHEVQSDADTAWNNAIEMVSNAIAELPSTKSEESSAIDNVLTLLDGIWSSGRMDYYSDYSALHDAISQISAQPERKKGEWIEYIPEHGKCPFCGNQVDLLGGKANNFCGECGADLRGAEK